MVRYAEVRFPTEVPTYPLDCYPYLTPIPAIFKLRLPGMIRGTKALL